MKNTEFTINIDDPLLKKSRFFVVAILTAFLVNMVFPQIGYAKPLYETKDLTNRNLVLTNVEKIDLISEKYIAEKNKQKFLNTAKEKFNTQERWVTATAYSSTVDQCDSTPCITANGYNVCEANKENVIAANFLRFGTKVLIPDLYGDTVFTVQDRMHPRFSSRIDLWKTSRHSAIQFGAQRVKIIVLYDKK